MKRCFFAVIALLIFVLIGCDSLFSPKADDNPNNSDNPDNSDNPKEVSAKYAKEYWGEWLRMDTDETWYITSGAIKINNSTSSRPVSLSRQSDRVIEVSDNGRKYYLYASRVANASFSGKVAGFDQPAQSTQRSIAGGKGFINLVIEDLNDKANTITTTTDGDGNFTVDNIIPGNKYEITPEGGTPATVIPNGNGDDVGTITITSGINFKTTINSNPSYADYADMRPYDFSIIIENTGTVDCTAATYQLDFAEDLIVESVPASQILGTIEPGKTKTIDITVRCLQIQNEYEYKKIGITITDPISGKTWDDSVSLRFHKSEVYFYIRANSAVSGVVISPTAQAYTFRNVTYTIVFVPWSAQDYLVVFSGATADTEAVYSLGIGVTPDIGFDAFTDTANYERNDTEDTAKPIFTQDKIMSYLHKNDIDYYKVNLGTAAPMLNYVSLVDFSYRGEIGTSDRGIHPSESAYLDIMVKNNIAAAVNITSAVLSTASEYVTLDKSTGAIGDLPARSSSNFPSAFKFTVSKTCPVGTNIPFTVTFTDSWGKVWTDSFEVPIVKTEASVALAGRKYMVDARDGQVNPRYSYYLNIIVGNTGTSKVLGVTAELSTTSEYATLDKSTGTIGDLSAGYYTSLTLAAYEGYASSVSSLNDEYLYYFHNSSSTSSAFKFTVSETCPIGTNIPFTVTFTDSWGNIWTDSFEVPVV
jgi:hypothetical protein